MASMKQGLFEKLVTLYEDTAAHPTLLEMEAELGAIRAYDLVMMLIVQADQIASLWQTEIQKGN